MILPTDLLQHHISKFSMYLWPTFRYVQVYTKSMLQI